MARVIHSQPNGYKNRRQRRAEAKVAKTKRVEIARSNMIRAMAETSNERSARLEAEERRKQAEALAESARQKADLATRLASVFALVVILVGAIGVIAAHFVR